MQGVLPTLGVVPATLGLVYGVGATAIVVQKYVPAFIYFGLVAVTMVSPFVVHEEDTQLRALNTLLSVYCCKLASRQMGLLFWSTEARGSFRPRVPTFHDSRMQAFGQAHLTLVRFSIL